MKFRPIKPYKDALSRLVSEAVWIEANATMNSKGEWRTNKIMRLSVDKSRWAIRKEDEMDKDTEKRFNAGMEKIKSNMPSTTVDNVGCEDEQRKQRKLIKTKAMKRGSKVHEGSRSKKWKADRSVGELDV